MYKVIKPLVPGEFALGTKYIGHPGKRDVIDPLISFIYTPDEDIYAINPIYFVSERFKKQYIDSNLNGIKDFIELRTQIAKEHFGMVKPYGRYFKLVVSEEINGNDFIKDRTKLLVSENAIIPINI